ncbi:MAG: hypothetical protein H2041_01435 [Phenylobacterium sp.]|uniref:hypothetical protein n=1 Tax=Phenylobacterium sp. TaxID=1871053 RepID=UPI0017970296|nr:hypothetical protein [Phenylobacterium sp.]MBA4792308.1 hypothetical protein [Phenylobacterium sp.]
MRPLAISDLYVMAAEPRVRDLELGERLGFERVSNVRNLIRRNADELADLGVLATVAKTSGKAGGRPTTEYLLNEAQALLVCMFARTPEAAEVRRQVIEVFMAWRRGELQAAPRGDVTPIAAGDPVAAQLARLTERLDALEGLGQRLRDGDHGARALALTHADVWAELRPGRRPALFGDVEVRQHILATHRQGRIDDVLAGMRERFGPARTPSRSTLHRWWLRLDELKRARGGGL